MLAFWVHPCPLTDAPKLAIPPRVPRAKVVALKHDEPRMHHTLRWDRLDRQPSRHLHHPLRVQQPRGVPMSGYCEDFPCCGHEAGDCNGQKYGSDESIKAEVYRRLAMDDDWPDEDY